MIAGETSRAYQDVFTINLVTCRAVGIGAYLVRLGQRVIQVDNSHIILTGSGALNKVLGKEVYESNAQLGGIQIMFFNGITHLTAPTDFQGIQQIVKWLAFIPRTKGAPIPIMPPVDPVDRTVGFMPTSLPYDPRWMIGGRTVEGKFESGFFDEGSFIEVQSKWAQTVVCGRARLGGIPVGVITVETRTVEVNVPADPANLDTEFQVISQAGQVWFPDSAFKTAQAIQDFNKEELPLMIFANWRGFSGGMRDMYEEVIKYGAMIVDALVDYRQPILVYMPPHGELRGGAWVVVDPTINPDFMEMYADKECRGGVLEPEGTIEIKFKQKDIIKAMTRLDPKYSDLVEKSRGSELTKEDRQLLMRQVKAREDLLSPMYRQVAVQFADLHDTPGRMMEKGVITDILEWPTSRKFFYWRLRRLLCKQQAIRRIMSVNRNLSYGQGSAMLRRWFAESKGTVNAYLWHNNEAVVEWLEQELRETDPNNSVFLQNVELLKRDHAVQEVKRLIESSPEIAMDTLIQLVNNLSPEQKTECLQALRGVLGGSLAHAHPHDTAI